MLRCRPKQANTLFSQNLVIKDTRSPKGQRDLWDCVTGDRAAAVEAQRTWLREEEGPCRGTWSGR
jgi:hypothetical protein